MTTVLKNEDGSLVEINNYHYSDAFYRKRFEAVGFINFHWGEMCLSPAGLAKMGTGYWDHFIKHPFVISFCSKNPYLTD